MSPMATSWIAFGFIFGGSLLGMFLRSRLPESHLSTDSKDVLKLAMGVLGTMSGLVLALLINSAKTSHDAQNGEMMQMAADFISLDRVLDHYGPQTKGARDLLRTTVAQGLGQFEGQNNRAFLDSTATRAGADNFLETIQQLQPQNDYQKALHAQAIQIASEAGRMRSILLEQTQGSIPMPFLVVLVFWLTVIFTGFGLFAHPNPTVVGVLLLSSLSIAAAIFLVMELDRPFEGLIQISDAPLRNAVAHMGK
jgi:Protein of unknown function (DUF4239)